MIPAKSSGSIALFAAFAASVTLWASPSARSAAPARSEAADKADKPSISLKANPTIAFSPANIFFVAEIKGGPNDSEALYCPSVEWEWDDGTKDESSSDCEPYEAGKSQIKRRYVAQKRYQSAYDYRVKFRLKQKDKVVAFATTQVKIRPGVREPIGF
jgi:hypothetical protein